MYKCASDPRLGVYDMRARWWSPRLGAFLQADKFAYVDANSTLWGWGNQNPTRWSDPSGNCPACVGAAVGAVAGFVGGAVGGSIGAAFNAPISQGFGAYIAAVNAGGWQGAIEGAEAGAGAGGLAGLVDALGAAASSAGAGAGAGVGAGSGGAAAAAGEACKNASSSGTPFTPAETEGLRQLFGKNVPGAQSLLNGLGSGQSVSLPDGVTASTLFAYKDLAENAVANASTLDKSGLQAIRLQAVDLLLEQLGNQ